MRSSAFMTVCSVEKTCPAVSALSSSLKMEGEIVSVPPQCGKLFCSGTVTLLFWDIPCWV